MTRMIGSIAIGIAGGGLALAYILQSQWVAGLIVAGIGVVWLLGTRAGWSWSSGAGLAGLAGAAGIGLWDGLPALWMLVGAILTLVAWDLQRFGARLARVQQVDGEARLVRTHLRWLAVVAGLALVLGTLALEVRVPLTFGSALVLAAVALIAFRQILRTLLGHDA